MTTSTYRAMINLITAGFTPTVAWDYYMIEHRDHTVEQIAEMRGVGTKTVKQNVAKINDSDREGCE